MKKIVLALAVAVATAAAANAPKILMPNALVCVRIAILLALS